MMVSFAGRMHAPQHKSYAKMAHVNTVGDILGVKEMMVVNAGQIHALSVKS